MTRPSRHHVCTACGATSPKWTGRCAVCGEWNTLVERLEPRLGTGPGSMPPGGRRAGGSGGVDGVGGPAAGFGAGGPAAGFGAGAGAGAGAAYEWTVSPGTSLHPVPIPSVSPDGSDPFPTGIEELDRVLSGGLVPGSVTLLGGEPGIGKSTLVLQAVSATAEQGGKALIVAAEESAEQVSRRAARLGSVSEAGFLLSTGDLMAAIEAADRVSPRLLVIDSIQTISDPATSSPAGSPNQVRECAQLLARYAKATGTATILVGHVTKDGALAGPRTLEHLVDTVLSFEGDRHHALRSLVATKHRYGPAGELGLFEMGEDGLMSISDPSAMLLGDRRPDAAGTVALPVVEGRRPLLVEVQALVARSHGGAPRRVVQGVSSSRLALLLAVLEGCCGCQLASANVFVSTVGGIKVTEPASDLAVALAVLSSITGFPLPPDAVVFGELGLAGEVRQVARPERRLAEAARLGFRQAIAPAATPDGPTCIQVRRVSSVGEAVGLLGWMELVRRQVATPPPAA
jgi:DNA repair protein RadA/Sms